MWKDYNERRNNMFLLCARRDPKEEWSVWTHTENIETIKSNIQTIEGFGWQWNVRYGEDDER